MVIQKGDRSGMGAGLIAIIVIVAIAAVAGTVYYLYGMAGPDQTVYSLQEGDFVEYTHGPNTYKLEVISTGPSTMTVNMTNNIGGWMYYQTQEVPLDHTPMLDFSYSDPPPGYDVDYLGKVSVSTAWGQKSADHYQASFEEEGHSMAVDIWLLRGIPLRIQTTYDGHPQDSTTLTDTNLTFITS